VIDRSRYGRQILVAEIGEAGQARIEVATVALSGPGLAHEIACTYAERAGVSRIVPGLIDEREKAPTFLENATARAVVAGSRAALAALRSALGAGPDRP
jgi:hypothetical protein